MRKLVLSILCLMMMSTYVFAGGPINFSVSIIDEKPKGHDRPKSPIQPPIVYLEDYTLTFTADHPEYVLTIKNEESEVVYTTVVSSAETQVLLPTTLSGEYQIELAMGNWLFTGYIIL